MGRAVLLAALLVLAGLLLAGCRLGGDEGGPSSSCTTPGPVDGPSPTWSFRCEVQS